MKHFQQKQEFNLYKLKKDEKNYFKLKFNTSNI